MPSAQGVSRSAIAQSMQEQDWFRDTHTGIARKDRILGHQRSVRGVQWAAMVADSLRRRPQRTAGRRGRGRHLLAQEESVWTWFDFTDMVICGEEREARLHEEEEGSGEYEDQGTRRCPDMRNNRLFAAGLGSAWGDHQDDESLAGVGGPRSDGAVSHGQMGTAPNAKGFRLLIPFGWHGTHRNNVYGSAADSGH